MTIDFPARLIDTARNETARRGHGFEGIWNAKRISFTRTGEFVRDVILIRKQNGILHMRWGNSAYECRGPLLQLAGQLHGILIDESDDSILFCLLNGGEHAAGRGDGRHLHGDRQGRTADAVRRRLPARARMQSHRRCRRGRRRYEEIKSRAFLWDRTHITPDEYAHLMRDIGPKAYAAGGDLFLRSPLVRSLSRGGAQTERV